MSKSVLSASLVSTQIKNPNRSWDDDVFLKTWKFFIVEMMMFFWIFPIMKRKIYHKMSLRWFIRFRITASGIWFHCMDVGSWWFSLELACSCISKVPTNAAFLIGAMSWKKSFGKNMISLIGTSSRMTYWSKDFHFESFLYLTVRSKKKTTFWSIVYFWEMTRFWWNFLVEIRTGQVFLHIFSSP